MADVATMGAEAKIEEAMRRSLSRLGPEARAQVSAMLTPESLAIISATLIVWVGSHAFGVGEIVDIILLVAGFALLGFSAIDGANELIAFAQNALKAKTDAELDESAEHFARASAYWRSALLRYLEEAMAESYAQLRVTGVRGLLVGLSFPIDGGYVTVSQLAAEGYAVGTILFGGSQFTVRVVMKPWRNEP